MGEVYRRLAEHLDRLPDGFPPSEDGSEIRLLRGLFTPEEAELALHLTLDLEEAAAIAARAGLPEEEAEGRLGEMACKGLIFSAEAEGGKALYQAAPFVIGIYEFQVNRLSDGFLQDLNDYWSTVKEREEPRTISQLRTIPVNESVDSRIEVLPYENVHALVDAHDRFAVAPCICRSRARKLGRGCDAPIETCLIFGDFADYYVRTGRGRRISKDEAKALLVRADEANLVLNPTNSMLVSAICCCCGCCCGILRGLKYASKPSEAVASSFIAEHDEAKCVGCFKCVERCQMEAMTLDAGSVRLDKDRCIGCGLCVSTCPAGALSLVRKPGSGERPPETFFDTWRTIAKQRGSTLTA